MRATLALIALVMAGAPRMASADTLTGELSINWTGTVVYQTAIPNVIQYTSKTEVNGDPDYDFMTPNGNGVLSLTYVGQAPLTSVTLHYTAQITGDWTYNMFGSSFPTGGDVSGSYDGSITKNGISTSINDSFGPVSQSNSYQYGVAVPKSTDVSDQVVPTPASSWSSYDNGDGTYTFLFTSQVFHLAATTVAECTAYPHGASSAESRWSFNLATQTVSVDF